MHDSAWGARAEEGGPAESGPRVPTAWGAGTSALRVRRGLQALRSLSLRCLKSPRSFENLSCTREPYAIFLITGRREQCDASVIENDIIVETRLSNESCKKAQICNQNWFYGS